MYDELGRVAYLVVAVMILLGLLFISSMVMAALKWYGVITWSWWAALSPLWALVALLAIIYGISFAVEWSRR